MDSHQYEKDQLYQPIARPLRSHAPAGVKPLGGVVSHPIETPDGWADELDAGREEKDG